MLWVSHRYKNNLFSAFVLLFALAACTHSPIKPDRAIAATQEVDTPVKALPYGSLEAILTANIAIHRNDLSTALGLLSQQTALIQSPALASTTALLASFLKQYDIAQDAIDIWLEADPSNKKAQDIKAKTFIFEQKPIQSFAYIVNNNLLDNDELLVFLATETLKQTPAKIDNLHAEYQQTLKQHPNNQGLLTGLALFNETSNLTFAIKLAEQAYALDDESIMVTGILAALQSQKDISTGINTLERALEKQPDHYGLKRQLARTLINHDIVKARSLLQELLTISPDEPSVLYYLAQANMRLDLYKEASPLLDKLTRHPPYADYGNYSLGLIAEQRQEYFIAAHHYHFIKQGQYLTATLHRLERLAIALNSRTEFEQHITQLKQDSPQSSFDLSLFELEYLLRANELDRAELLADVAINTYGNKPKLLYGKFMIADKQKRYQVAANALETILQQQHDNPVILNALGYTLSRYLGRHEEAKTLISEAMTLKPNDASIIDSMGWVLLNLGQLDEALKHLLLAYSRSANTDIAAHLGEVLWLKEQHEEAIGIWQDAYLQDADNEELLDTLQRYDVKLSQP